MEHTIREVKRTERGWGGHFVGSRHCEFRRNTLLECGEARLVVSSVGAYMPKEDGKYALVNGYGFYETLAFAPMIAPYWDIDPRLPIHFDGKWYIDKISNSIDIEANDMHEAIVHELSERLRKDDTWMRGLK